MKIKMLFLLLLIGYMVACGGETLPKPKAFLRLEYAKGNYQKTNLGNCPFSFEKNNVANAELKDGCSFNLNYKDMKAAIFVTYKTVNNNLEALLADAQKLTYEHVVKADNIVEQPFVNHESKVYGMFYKVSGNAASQTQFYVTDSTKNFITGSLYFYAKPNYDSILPAKEYLENDIRRLMESFKWK